MVQVSFSREPCFGSRPPKGSAPGCILLLMMALFLRLRRGCSTLSTASGVKATFFMVGQNVERHPELLDEVRRRGHSVGNHTLHHIQGASATTIRYMRDAAEGASLTGSALFRPPHGWLRPRQLMALKKHYRVIMYDLVTRDYSRHMTAEDVVENVKKYARDGSIIVFHDSLKSIERLRTALPESLSRLRDQGYEFMLLDT